MQLSERLAELSQGQLLSFYERLAHNLTITIRGIWSDPQLGEAEKLEQMKWVNEIVHRTTGRLLAFRHGGHDGLSTGFGETIEACLSQAEGIAASVLWAVERSYRTVAASRVEIVQNLYEAFATRDRDRILEIFDPEIEWIQNEGFPRGGRHVGAEVVLNDVFAKFKVDWETWQAVVERWLDAGETIVALGEYRGTHKETGRSMKAAFAHVYWLRSGRIVRFEQYADTLKVAEAMRLE